MRLLRFLRLGLLALVLLACQQNFAVQQTKTQHYVFDNGKPQTESNLDAFIKPYRDSLTAKMSRILAFSDAELLTGRAGKDMLPTQVAMGNFMVDACLEVASQKAVVIGKPVPDISIFTWGSIRKSLPSGNLTLGNVFELMPFENEMIVLKLNGKQVLVLLNQLAANYNPMAGASITKGEPNSVLINGSPIDEKKFYYVVVSDYLSFGGDNLSVLTEAADRYWCGIKVRDALVLYLENLTTNGKTLKPNYEQRIRN